LNFVKPNLSALTKHAHNPYLRKIYKYIASHKKLITLLLLAITLFITFTDTIITVLVLVAMGIPATFITMYKRFVRLPPALELISITTVMATIFYGPIIGIIYTIIVNVSSEIASGHPDEMTLTYFPSRIIQVLFIHFTWTYGLITTIFAVGVWSVVAFNAVQQPLFMALVDVEKRLKAIYFIALNIPLNILIFKTFGQPLFAVLSLIID